MDLQEKLFAQVVKMLSERGLIIKKSTIADTTIISASSSTKYKEKKRDHEAHSVKKGNQCFSVIRRMSAQIKTSELCIINKLSRRKNMM